MRKIMVLIASVVLMLSISCNCLGEGEKKILFRDVPWGSTLAETMELLTDFKWGNGLIAMSGFTKPNKVTEKTEPFGITPIELLYPDTVPMYSHYPMSFDIYSFTSIEVAGYSVNETKMYFAYTFAGNQIENNEDNGRLISAHYKFNGKNDASMRADIESKLCSVYGDVSQKLDIQTKWGLENYSIWEDDEAKIFLRYRAANDSKKKSILVLYYIWNDWQVLLDEIENKLIDLGK